MVEPTAPATTAQAEVKTKKAKNSLVDRESG